MIDIVEPVVRDQKRRVDQWDARRLEEPIGEAAPRPVLGTADQSSPEGIALDVAAHPHERGRRLNRMCLESALIDRAFPDGLVVASPAHRVGSLYPVHELRQRPGFDRTHDQMPVIGEQAVGYEPYRMLLETRKEYATEGPVVEPFDEDRLSADASVYDVEKACGRRGTGPSRHVGGLRGIATPMPVQATVGGLAP